MGVLRMGVEVTGCGESLRGRGVALGAFCAVGVGS